MAQDYRNERSAQDNFKSMVGETGPYPNDPQHPDPGYDVDAGGVAPIEQGPELVEDGC